MSTLKTRNTPTHIVVMGVSGCGKSTLAKAIATHLGWPMVEGDAFHTAHNVTKMATGQALNDDDRVPWLAKLNNSLQQRNHTVLSCSALKARYRAALSHELPIVPLFVHVHGSYDHLLARMQAREDHFMPPSLLRSQFDALEMPNEAGLCCITVSTEDSTDEQLKQVLAFIQQANPESTQVMSAQAA